MPVKTLHAAWLLPVTALLAAPTLGQSITLPPSGANQKASSIQNIGLVEVRIDYSSPDVTGPNGEDRRGKIWGQLVPYGMANLGFGTATESPWRAGANENTVFSVTHDVLVEGEPLAAGRYGLHMIPGERMWTVIFSHNSTSWGSFFYDPNEDALRVEVEAEKVPFREWLTYDFVDRQPDRATVALHWEELRVPLTISVPNVDQLYLAQIRRELRGSPGFNWQSWNAAAQFSLNNGGDPEEALRWAETAVSTPFIGQESFATLSTRAQALAALDRGEEAQGVMDRALRHPTATVGQIHGYARSLQARGEIDEAVRIFELNAELNGDAWPINVGLARAYSAKGEYEKALRYAKLAHAEAPDPVNKSNLEKAIGILEEGRDFNLTN